jgi:hypothetical protein
MFQEKFVRVRFIIVITQFRVTVRLNCLYVNTLHERKTYTRSKPGTSEQSFLGYRVHSVNIDHILLLSCRV